MPHKYSRQLAHCVGEEAQLLAEERWLVDTLAKIKHQRNCLQIERLHLDSLKTKSKVDSMKKGNNTNIPSTPQQQISNETLDLPSTSAVNLMQNAAAPHTEYGTPGMLMDGYCNNEVLDLAVNHDAFGNLVNTSSYAEEDDDDYEEDIDIDMNMFMNGNDRLK